MSEYPGAGDLLRRSADRVLGRAATAVALPEWVKQLGGGGDLPLEPGGPDRRPERPSWLIVAFLGGFLLGQLYTRACDWLLTKAALGEADVSAP